MKVGLKLFLWGVLVTRLSCHPLLLPHNLYHHFHVGPAVQDYFTPTQCYLSRAASQTRFPLQLLQSLFLPLYVHLCMALVWHLLATTPVVWTAAHSPGDPKEAQHLVIIQPPL